MFEGEAQRGDERASMAPPWTPVLDVTGEPIGSIADEPPQNDYLAIYKGLFFPKLVYIPMIYATRTDSYGVHLSLRKADLVNECCPDPASSDSPSTIAFSAC